MEERRSAAIEEFKEKASQMDFDFQSIFGKMNGSSPKYRNPDDPTQTYSRGSILSGSKDGCGTRSHLYRTLI